KPMHDEWPRHYTAAELETIAQSIGREKLRSLAAGKLQEGVVAYQWANAADQNAFAEHGAVQWSLSKRRREKLKNILSHCDQGEADEVDIALNDLDAWTSQRLGAVNTTDLAQLKCAAERVLRTIEISGPDRQRARRQYIRDLACIFAL